MAKKLLQIKNLNVSVSETQEEILKGVNLEIGSGETHVIMGPNGGGKSTLVNVIAGRDSYQVDSGSIKFKSEDLLDMTIDERARKGIFLAFQYPSEIPGVRPWQFVKAAVDAKRKTNGDAELSVREFSKIYDNNLKEINISEDLMKRSLNEGFSGGEKKRNEIFQMMMLEPNLALLDETDSGLDVDAFKTITNGVNKIKNEKNSFLIITHYQKLLENIVPTYIHIMKDGKIIKTGDKSLAEQIENEGFQSY